MSLPTLTDTMQLSSMMGMMSTMGTMSTMGSLIDLPPALLPPPPMPPTELYEPPPSTPPSPPPPTPSPPPPSPPPSPPPPTVLTVETVVAFELGERARLGRGPIPIQTVRSSEDLLPILGPYLVPVPLPCFRP